MPRPRKIGVMQPDGMTQSKINRNAQVMKQLANSVGAGAAILPSGAVVMSIGIRKGRYRV